MGRPLSPEPPLPNAVKQLAPPTYTLFPRSCMGTLRPDALQVFFSLGYPAGG
jgi:hypothetical protein